MIAFNANRRQSMLRHCPTFPPSALHLSILNAARPAWPNYAGGSRGHRSAAAPPSRQLAAADSPGPPIDSDWSEIFRSTGHSDCIPRQSAICSSSAEFDDQPEAGSTGKRTRAPTLRSARVLRSRHATQYQFVVPFNMKRAHLKTLELIFSRPVSANVRWSDIEALFIELGAKITQREGSRVAVVLFGQVQVFHRPHPRPTTDKGAVAGIRKWLESNGVKP